MSTVRNYLRKSAQPYPHVGSLIRKKLRDLQISTPQAARLLGVSTSTVHNYYKQPSVQVGILWNLSLALKYDLLSELIRHYPKDFPVKVDEKIGELEKEVEIYKSLLKR